MKRRKTLTFKCLRCGNCCDDLISESRFGTRKGLVIYPEERSLFSEEFISPFHGVGKMPEDKFFRILTYQVNANTCPHLQKLENSSTCAIHESRPLACRSFPFRYLGNPFEVVGPERLHLAVEGICWFIQKHNVRSLSVLKAPKEKKAAEEMALRISIRKGAQWYFDLSDEKGWVLIGRV